MIHREPQQGRGEQYLICVWPLRWRQRQLPLKGARVGPATWVQTPEAKWRMTLWVVVVAKVKSPPAALEEEAPTAQPSLADAIAILATVPLKDSGA
jgi:hypothetical protein